jgi:hypothetical protein
MAAPRCNRHRWLIDLGKGRDEGVAEFLDRGEETQEQVRLRHGGEEPRIKLLVFAPNRAHQKCRSLVERQLPLPFFRIKPDRKVRMAGRAARQFFEMAREVGTTYGSPTEAALFISPSAPSQANPASRKRTGSRSPFWAAAIVFATTMLEATWCGLAL